jgi:hypothetical protein
LIKVKRAVETEVIYEDEIKKLDKKITKDEAKELNGILVANKIEDGIGNIEGFNLWKLAQGLGAVAREKSVSRKKELEEIAGSLI